MHLKAGDSTRTMNGDAERMHLGVYAAGTGNHVAGWRYPGASKSGEDFTAFRRIAESAERGRLDFVFVGDNLACVPEEHPGMVARLEPLTLLSALAALTRRVGLIGTASTTYSQPYSLARRFASLDHISGGRGGWNVVTTSVAGKRRQFRARDACRPRSALPDGGRVRGSGQGACGIPGRAGHGSRDPETGVYVDPARIHALDHEGEFYSVRGPLNHSRSPQGRPVIVQAGASESGQAFAARHAEVLFSVQQDIDAARAFRSGIVSKGERRGPGRALHEGPARAAAGAGRNGEGGARQARCPRPLRRRFRCDASHVGPPRTRHVPLFPRRPRARSASLEAHPRLRRRPHRPVPAGRARHFAISTTSSRRRVATR